MKVLFISIVTILTSLFTFANSHIIVKKNGEKMEVNYVTSKDNIIYYTMSGNSQQYEISAFAVGKLIDKSNNQEIISNEKIDLTGDKAYKNVQIINNDQTQGLNSGEEFEVKIQKIKGHSESTWTKWTLNRLKKRAASEGYAYLVITKQTTTAIKAVGYKI